MVRLRPDPIEPDLQEDHLLCLVISDDQQHLPVNSTVFIRRFGPTGERPLYRLLTGTCDGCWLTEVGDPDAEIRTFERLQSAPHKAPSKPERHP